MSKNKTDPRLRRFDASRVEVENAWNIPVTLFASEDVSIESEGIDQFLEFLDVHMTVSHLSSWEDENGFWWGSRDTLGGRINKVVLTPDFHRGGSIPIGTVVETEGFVMPKAPGNDVGCGVRSLITDVTTNEIKPHLDVLEKRLRAIFFGGERNIPLSPRQRFALLKHGLLGLYETSDDNAGTGIWKYYDKRQQLDQIDRVHDSGGYYTTDIFNFADYVKGSGAQDSRDAHIGSVGGNNHFVEIQAIESISDGYAAREWGIQKDNIAIMAHSGSLGLGHMVGKFFEDQAKAIYPKSLARPKNDFYVLPTSGRHKALTDRYLSAMSNAANFAFGNRLFLGLMVVRALSEVLGRTVKHTLVYDACHNLIWSMGDNRFLHRKGATPAEGFGREPFSYMGRPVLVPGSMGSASYILAGTSGDENTKALESAPHGAGRAISRGETAHVSNEIYDKTFEKLRIVTPIDPKSPEIARRSDILAKYHSHLRQEAPFAYKEINSVVDTVESAGIAKKVARLWPIMTMKGL